jgi:triosephosphate isomerase
VKYVICGHSERRQYFGETDEFVAAKVAAVMKFDMLPIVCVGETKDEREAGTTLERVESQVKGSLKGRTGDQIAALVIAYEPIWAIGTGLTATAQDAQDVCHHIRSVVRTEWGNEAAEKVRIQYGGSVKAGNVSELMAQPDIDGALVGGASIDPDEFARIVQFRN